MTESTHVDWEGRLNSRYWALAAALKELRGEEAISSEEYREYTVGILEELKKEIGADFRAFREERGIPDVTVGGR